VNGNELCTKALWDHADSECVSYVGVDHKGAEFICDIHSFADKQEYKH